MPRAMNRKKRLDAPSKQEARERYESARKESVGDAKSEQDNVSGAEGFKRLRDDSDNQSSDLRDKIPKLSRTIEGNDQTGSLIVNIGKDSEAKSLVDPSYGDRSAVETFDYSHRLGDNVPLEGDTDDLRSLIDKQRKTSQSEKDSNSTKDSKKGSIVFDSKRKDSRKTLSSSGRSDKSNKGSRRCDESSKKKQGGTVSPSGYDLGKPFFSQGGKGDKKKSKPEEMDMEETLKELAYLRSIQTGENALPKEEEEYFLKMNDLSKAGSTINLDNLLTGNNANKKKQEKSKSSTDLSQSASKWEKVIDIVSGKTSSKTDSVDDGTYGPSLPPKVPTTKALTTTSKKTSSSSKSSSKDFPLPVRGGRGGRARGRGIRGRGRGRGRGLDDAFVRGRGRARGLRGGRGGRGSFPLRGRHIFTNKSSSRRRSRSSSRSSRSSSSSRSRSRSRSRGRRSTKKRRRSSSRSSYSSSSRSRSRSPSRSKSRKSRQTRRRSRSRSSSRSRSRSKSKKTQGHSKERQRSRSKSSSRSRSRKRKDRSRSWSFDEVYTNKDGSKTNKQKNKQNKPTDKDGKTDNNNKRKDSISEDKRIKVPQGKDPEKSSKEKPKPNPSLSPAVAALAIKELKVASGSGVFLPRTVTKTISKGMQIPKGRGLSIKTHPVFAVHEEPAEESQKPESPKEREEDKEQRHQFAKEIDKVFNAKPWPQENKARGKWTPVLSVEEQKEKLKAQEEKSKDVDIQDKIDVEMEVESENTKDIFDDKSKDEDKKERKEKRKKEKEEKSKRKKEKKEKKEKKKKEKELEASGVENAATVEGAQGDFQGEAYNEYGQAYQEYPEGGYNEEYQQGWYDENGEFHPNEEGEYYYYYDAEGNIVGYEGPEGYVEGNPFEGQEYATEGQEEAWQANQEYHGGYEGGQEQYEFRGQDQETYYMEEQYQEQGDTGQWENYQGEQQWYDGSGGAYPEVAEPLTEDQYSHEGHTYQQSEAVNPHLINQNVTADPEPTAVHEQPTAPGIPASNPQSLITELAAKANPTLMLEMAARGIGEKELISFLGAQLTQFAKAQGLPYEDAAKAKPMEAPMDLGPPKPVIREEQSLQREDSHQKPLKSILKKGNPISVKPPSKEDSPLLKTDDKTVEQECIVRISDRGVEQFFCKLCKCHIESPIAKDLHIKSMKHIELFVREKSSLLQSVIGSMPGEKESVASDRDSEESRKVADKREIERKKSLEDKEDSSWHGRKESRTHRYGESAEDGRDKRRVMDYDRLRLREWHLRESSGSAEQGQESEHITRDYGHGKKPREEQEQPRDHHDYDYHYEYRRESDEYRESTYDDKSRERYSDRDDHSDYQRSHPYPSEDRQIYSERLPRDFESERQTRRRSVDRESDSSRRSAVSMSIEDSEHEYREFFEYSGQYPLYDNERDNRPLHRSESKEQEYGNSQRYLEATRQRPQDSRVRDTSYKDRKDQPDKSKPTPQQSRQREASREGSAQPDRITEIGRPQPQQRMSSPKQVENGRTSSSHQDRTSSSNRLEPTKQSQSERQEASNQRQRTESSDKGNSKSVATKERQNSAPSRSERPSSADKSSQKKPIQDQKKSRSTEQNLLTQGTGKKSSYQEKNQLQQSQTTRKDHTDQSKSSNTGNKTNISQQRQQKTSQPSQQKQLPSEQKPPEKPKMQSKPEQKPNVAQKSKETSAKIVEKSATPSNAKSLLGPPPGQPISTVTPGQASTKPKRVPPPPPPYSQGSGPNAIGGRGFSPRGRGGHPNPSGAGRGYLQNPSSQSGGQMGSSSQSASMGVVSQQSRVPPQMGGFPPSNRVPSMGGHSSSNRGHLHMAGQPQPNRGLPHMGVQPPSLHVGGSQPPSRGPPQMQAYSPQGAMGQALTGSYYGNAGRAQPSPYGRGSSPLMRGSPQFAGRARGGRGYHPQRW